MDRALTSGRDEDCTPSSTKPARKPKLWFEVEDFLRHFDYARHVTGIQRITIEVLTEVERLFGGTGRVGFCRLDRDTQEFEPVGFVEIAEAYARPPAERGALENAAGWIGRRLRRARSAHFLSADDVLICLGAAWINSRYGQSIAAAKSDQGVRFVLLIHDLIPFTHASLVDRKQAAIFSAWIPDALASADFVLTVSRYSRDALIALAKARGWTLPPVEVLPLGATFQTRRSRKAAKYVPMESSPRPLVLYVSTIEPRKNHLFLIEIWRRLIARHGRDLVPDLVCVGWFSDPDSQLRKDVLSADLDGKLRVLTDLSDEALTAIYRQCLFTVYPSLCEGWGLPVAESLTHGKLCVASDATSLPEVGGRLVDYFDPADIEDALAKIERPLLDPAYLAARERRVRDAYVPASWSDCARWLVEMLDQRGAAACRRETRR